MWATNLKILGTVIVTVGAYTLVANVIPQVESKVPEEISFSGNVTPEQLVSAGEKLFEGAGGCTACHGLGTRAPNLLTSEGGLGPIGSRCGSRVAGMTCKEYLHQSVSDPTAFVVEGYNPIMPDFGKTLSAQQIWALVAFLESQGGQVDVTADDLPAAGAETAPAGNASATAGASTASLKDPRAIIDAMGCLQCHKLGDEGGPIAPPFDGVGSRLSRDKIQESILRPNADTAKGYEKFAGVMPPNFGERLTAAQLDTLVSFLAAHK